MKNLEISFQETLSFCIITHTQFSFLLSQEFFKNRLVSRFLGDHSGYSGSQMLCPGSCLVVLT